MNITQLYKKQKPFSIDGNLVQEKIFKKYFI